MTAYARNSDPTESFQAAESVNVAREMRILLTAMQGMLLHGELPADDSAIYWKIRSRMPSWKATAQGIRSRRAEAVRRGFVKRVDRDGVTSTGRHCSRWSLTKKGVETVNTLLKEEQDETHYR